MIEDLNLIITIQRNVTVVDQYGNHKNQPTDYYTCHASAGTGHAYVDSYSREDSTFVTVEDERNIIFEVRYCAALAGINSSDYQVVFNNDVYNIESVNMVNWKKRFIKIKCRRVPR